MSGAGGAASANAAAAAAPQQPLTGGLALLAEQQAAERAAAAARVAAVAVKRTANKIVLSKPKPDAAPAAAAAGAAAAGANGAAATSGAASGVGAKPGGTVADPHKTFEALDADAVLETMNTMQSLCMNCHAEDAETKLLLTRIPYFRDVIIMSTECAHCHYRTNEIQPANEIAEKGVRYELEVKAGQPHTKQDLNRQIIKAETATVLIPTIEFELPAASSKRGEINTLEGFLVSFAENLELLQHERREKVPQLAAALQPVIEKLRAFAEGKQSFTFVVDDPAGNSFFENVQAAAGKPDPRVRVTHYTRTAAQQEELGYAPDAAQPTAAAAESAAAGKGLTKAGAKLTHSERVKAVHMSESMFAKMDSYFDVTERAATLPGECPGCHKECDTRMCVVDVPFFKDIILMVTQCDHCGYKDSEVKPAGEVSEFGVKVTLTVNSTADLKRDMLKSDSAGISIPELDLELHEGTLGGKYTTLEGLFNDIKESLARVNPFYLGDSSDKQHKSKMAEFMTRLEELLFTVPRPFHVVLDDPMGNSFIQSLTGDKPDPQIVIEKYRRTHAQNDELGLNDMRTEGYHPELAAVEGAAAAAAAGVKAPAATAAAGGGAAAPEKHKPSDDFAFPSKADSRFAAPEVQVTATGSAPMVPGTDANAKPQAAAAAAAAAPAAAPAAAAAAKK